MTLLMMAPLFMAALLRVTGMVPSVSCVCAAGGTL
jgi:hypothetical protein